MYLRGVCDLEDTLEADALLANVPYCMLLGSAANIAQRSDVALCKPNLARSKSLQQIPVLLTSCWLVIQSNRCEQVGIAVMGALGLNSA